jgi:hypothetical protein
VSYILSFSLRQRHTNEKVGNRGFLYTFFSTRKCEHSDELLLVLGEASLLQFLRQHSSSGFRLLYHSGGVLISSDCFEVRSSISPFLAYSTVCIKQQISEEWRSTLPGFSQGLLSGPGLPLLLCLTTQQKR